MGTSIDPHKLDEPGFIVAWRSKKEFKAGKYLDKVMTLGEAMKEAEKLSQKGDGNTYWAEAVPQTFAPH
jgi:hypothetical protein